MSVRVDRGDVGSDAFGGIKRELEPCSLYSRETVASVLLRCHSTAEWEGEMHF